MTKKKTAPKPLASSPEYMRQYRLQRNPDVRSRIGIKARYYLSDKQAREIEKLIDEKIGWTQG